MASLGLKQSVNKLGLTFYSFRALCYSLLCFKMFFTGILYCIKLKYQAILLSVNYAQVRFCIIVLYSSVEPH